MEDSGGFDSKIGIQKADLWRQKGFNGALMDAKRFCPFKNPWSVFPSFSQEGSGPGQPLGSGCQEGQPWWFPVEARGAVWICSLHFFGGKECKEKISPAYLPTINMPGKRPTMDSDKERYQRALKHGSSTWGFSSTSWGTLSAISFSEPDSTLTSDSLPSSKPTTCKFGCQVTELDLEPSNNTPKCWPLQLLGMGTTQPDVRLTFHSKRSRQHPAKPSFKWRAQHHLQANQQLQANWHPRGNQLLHQPAAEFFQSKPLRSKSLKGSLVFSSSSSTFLHSRWMNF